MRFIISLVIFLMATPSFSDWVPIVTSTSGAEFFVDDKTIFNTSKSLHVQMLTNYSLKQDTGEISSVSDTIIKCNKFLIKDTRLKTFSKPFARGRQLSDHDLVAYGIDIWTTAEKGSTYFLFLTRLCAESGR